MLNKLKSLFEFGKSIEYPGRKRAKNLDVICQVNNWYSNIYRSAILQRNFLGILLIISIVVLLLITYMMQNVIETKEIRPFVVEVSESSGRPMILNYSNDISVTVSHALKRYFILKYIRAREEYSHITYGKAYYNTVRLLSSNDVWNIFEKNIAKDNPNSQVSRLGRYGSRTIKFDQELVIEGNKTGYIVATITEKLSNRATRQYRKKIDISFDFVNMSLTAEQREINPVGFRVTKYNTADIYK